MPNLMWLFHQPRCYFVPILIKAKQFRDFKYDDSRETLLMQPNDTLRKLRDHQLIFAITSGRSGTKLMARILEKCCDIQAEHEAMPRANFVLRSVQAHPDAAKWWLSSEKLPAIASRLDERPYGDISHLYCKGFIEPILQMGMKPDFIVLTRPAREVASSLYTINCIPKRSPSGQLVLLSPDDPGVLAPDDWQRWDDYQLCYWYAKEIERLQQHYSMTLPAAGCRVFEISMKELTDEAAILQLIRFLKRDPEARFDVATYRDIISVNQNPKAKLSAELRADLSTLDEKEEDVDATLARLAPAS